MAWGLINQAHATHLAGAELNYTFTGTNPDGTANYTVTVTWTRDCSGIALGSPTIQVRGCNGFVQTQVPNCGAPVPVPGICGNNPCANPPAGIVVYEQITCTANFTLPATPCGNYVFSTVSNARNGDITTIGSPGSQDLYVQSTLNNLNGNQNSPSFGNLPLLTVCAGQPFNFNNQGQPGNGGTLTYQMITPMTGANTTVNYDPGFGPNTPFVGPFNLNGTSGALSGTPGAQDVTVMAVLVTETDANGNVTGTTIRDIQLQIIPCNNQNPTVNPTTLNDTICVGVQYQNTFTSNDADGDAVTMSYGQEIAGANFQIFNNGGSGPFPSGVFTWTPGQNDVGNHTFTVQVVDDACPINGSNTYTYNLTVIYCCDDFEFNVASCCEVEIETPGLQSVQNTKNYADALQELSSSLTGGRSATPDSCDPCIDGWYPVWVEDDNGQPVGFGDPCITVEWLDQSGTVLHTGWAFAATPDVRYTVRVTNTCNGCTWEEDFFYCCESPDPGFTVQTRCTRSNFIISVTNITPATNSQFNLYTAIAPCTSNSCMLDSSNPDAVVFGNTATFILPKIAGAMYIIKHGEWTLCDSWQEQRQLILDTCCLGMDVEIFDWCDMLNNPKVSQVTQQSVMSMVDDYNKETGNSLSATPCDFCENPTVPFIIYAVDDQGTLLDPSVYNISWTSTSGATSTLNWIQANVNEIYYLEAIGPDNCIFRDTFQHVCCEAPEKPICRIDRRGRSVLSWDASSVASSYEIEITTNDPMCCRPQGRSQTITIPVNANGYTIPVSYVCASWRVRAICVNGDTSAYSASQCICGRFIVQEPQDTLSEVGGEKRTAGFGSDLQTYPSPASSFVILKGNDVKPGATIRLVDVSGRTVYAQDVTSEGKATVSTLDIPNGIYFIRLQGADNSISTRKVVIQH